MRFVCFLEFRFFCVARNYDNIGGNIGIMEKNIETTIIFGLYFSFGKL